MTKAQITKLVNELNGVLGLEPQISVKGNVEEISKKLATEVAGLLQSSDFEGNEALSQSTQKHLKVICEEYTSIIKKQCNQEYISALTDIGFYTEPDDVPDDVSNKKQDIEKTDDEFYESIEQIDNLKELKAIVRKSNKFEANKKGLIALKDLEDLREAMLDILDNVGEPESEPEPELEPETEDKPKAKPKNTGSFAAFMDDSLSAGGTWKQIFAKCEKEAKERGTKCTLGSVKQHAKYRLKAPKYFNDLKITEKGME